MSTGNVERLAGHFCGQTQPHAAHTWQTPPVYGSATVISTYQCAGITVAIEPGPCWHDSGVTWPHMSEGTTVRCELRAGHAGAHESDRGPMGGTAVWMDRADNLDGGEEVSGSVTPPSELMHRWVEPHGDLTACGIQWWNGTRGDVPVTCPACVASPDVTPPASTDGGPR